MLSQPSELMRRRTDRIADDLRQAAEQRAAMEQLKKEYDQRMAEIAAKSQKLIQNAIRDGQQARDQLLEEARAQSDAIMQRGKEHLEVERSRVLQEIRQQVIALAFQLTEKTIRDNMSDEMQSHMLETALRELEMIK